MLYSGRLFLPYPQTLDNNERLGRDKHSSLLRTFSNYNSKKFLTLGPGVDLIKHICINLRTLNGLFTRPISRSDFTLSKFILDNTNLFVVL